VPDEIYYKSRPKEKFPQEHEIELEKSKATTANFLGYGIVGGYIFSVIISLVACIFNKNIKPNQSIELIKSITNTFGTPLGFVLGYFYGVMKSK
jgi:hypothetical protein